MPTPTPIVWDKTSEHFYETGTDHGVLYLKSDAGTYENGVAWNGLTAVTESPSGADETALYADNIKYLSLRAAEEFGGTIECYTYPDEWEACDGSISVVYGVVFGQQGRSAFGFSYRTIVGNEVKGNEFGYKLHLIYGATASPSERAYNSVNDSPEAIIFSYEFSTIPETVSEKIDGKEVKPTSNIVINSTKLPSGKEVNLEYLEAILYGRDLTSFNATSLTGVTEGPRLPKPDEVIKIFNATITRKTSI